MQYKLIVETYLGASMDEKTFDSIDELNAYQIAEWSHSDHLITVEEINEDKS